MRIYPNQVRLALKTILRFCFLLVMALILFAGHGGCSSSTDDRPTKKPKDDSAGMKAEQLAQRSDRLDATVWADERLAQRYEAELVRFWDALRRSLRPDEILMSRLPPFLSLGKVVDSQTLDWDVVQTRYSDADGKERMQISRASAGEMMKRLGQEGFRLVQSEWHHASFRPPVEGRDAASDVSFEILLHDVARSRFRSLQGVARIGWLSTTGKASSPTVTTVELVDLVQTDRSGESPFRPAMKIEPDPRLPEAAVDVAPLIVRDLNGDGLPEVILGGSNLLLWNRGRFQFDRSALLRDPIVIRNAAAIADFTGDGLLDFLGVDDAGEGQLALGSEGALPFGHTTRCWLPTASNASALTVGDVDGDGDLDVWLAQYKTPYQGGQMPTPYYDANDGYPSYLLINDGHGQFTDGTQQAGLAEKRFRRTYSSSLVDLDDDGDLDLLVVSDFSGLDAYENDGKGHFREATDRWFGQRSGFGMAHTFGDFNGDGREDLYMVGMSSTTARRLDRLGLGRPDFPRHTKMRGPMTYGNRLLLYDGDRFVQPSESDQVARCGWAWGTAASDFDNDADDDLYVANGHLSGLSAGDYCTRFWCHDIYTGSSERNAEVARFLRDEFRPDLLRGLGSGDISWNGYEHNKLFINRGNNRFVEVAPLLGLASEFDSRSVVAADLDCDGRQDLLLVGIRWARPAAQTVARQSLHGWWNQLDVGHHWIGVQLRCAGRDGRSGGVSPIGARVTIRGDFGQRSARVMTGESFFSQHPTVVHFGLAESDRLDWIEVRWPNGLKTMIEKPEVDRYHVVLPSGARSSPEKVMFFSDGHLLEAISKRR